MADTPLPDLILYGRAGCALCAEAHELLDALLAERRAAGLRAPTLVERDIDTNDEWQRAFLATIPVVELGDRRIELATSLGAMRRLLRDVLDGQPASA